MLEKSQDGWQGGGWGRVWCGVWHRSLAAPGRHSQVGSSHGGFQGLDDSSRHLWLPPPATNPSLPTAPDFHVRDPSGSGAPDCTPNPGVELLTGPGVGKWPMLSQSGWISWLLLVMVGRIQSLFFAGYDWESMQSWDWLPSWTQTQYEADPVDDRAEKWEKSQSLGDTVEPLHHGSLETRIYI